MMDSLQEIRSNFNVVAQADSMTLTLVNPNLLIETILQVRDYLKSLEHLQRLEITIIECVNFDDQQLTALAEGLPQSLTSLTLDFSGCQSLKGSGFLQLFENISPLNLASLHLDFSEVFDINDIVLEGLSMLLSSQQGLKQLFLDLYEVDRVTQHGYLLLAEGVSDLKQLTKLHLDFSANPNLNEDNLELLFSSFPATLASLSFRIVDIDHIGGGSLFKLSEALTKACGLKQLALTISSFANLNPKGVHSVLKGISGCQQLHELDLNLSNINMLPKMLGDLKFPASLQRLSLDVSCNSLITDMDLVSLASRVQGLHSASFNFDFCSTVTEDAIEALVENLCQTENLICLKLNDRRYSPQFVSRCCKYALDSRLLLVLQINCAEAPGSWKHYKELQARKRSAVNVGLKNSQGKLSKHVSDIMRMFCPH